MARLPFPEAASRRADNTAGVPQPGHVYTVYLDPAGTVPANICADNNGAPGTVITGSQVVTDSFGYLPIWWGPDSNPQTDRLYITDGVVGPWPVGADTDTRIDDLTGRVATLEAGTGATAPVQSVAGKTGAVTLDAADVAGVETPSGAQAKANAAQTNAATALANHNTATAGVHGIADTSALETQTGAQAKATAAQTAATAASDPVGTAAAAINVHNADTTFVHGIDDTTALETVTGAQAKVDTAAALLIPLAQRAVANGVATLGSDGKLSGAQIPAIPVVNYLGPSADQAAMLALTGAQGDFTTRLDTSTNWVLTGGDPTVLADWTELTYPTAAVTSVAGRTGAVTVTKTDVGLGNADNTADTAKPVSTAQQAALDLKAPLASPAFTGTPTGITKAHVGLGNVLNLAPADLGVSTDTQTALDTKVQLGGDLAGTTTAPVIAAAAVTGTKIADGTIGAAKLATGAVTDTAVAAGANIAPSKIAGTALAAANNLSDVNAASARANLAVAASATTITTTAPLTGGGDLTTSRTIAIGNATTGALGAIQLAGDLAGTATAPTVPGLANKADDTAALHKATTETVTGAKTFNAGALLDKGNHIFDIKAYGALGNGTTDDTTAINAAIIAANAAGGGTVVVTPAASPYIFTSITLLSNVTLIGRGGTLKFKDNTAVNPAQQYYPILALSKSNVKLVDLVVDGNKANNPSSTVCDAITVSGGNIEVRNCTISNPPDSGVMFSRVTNSSLINNRVTGAVDVGFYINDGDGLGFYENVISGNRIDGCTNGGIALKRILSRCVVADNVIYNCGHGITLENGSTSSDFSTNLTVIGNRVRHIGYVGAGNGRGIDLRGSDNIVCVGNRVEDANLYGILLQATRYSSVADNVITFTGTANAGATGIWVGDRSPLTYGSARNTITGNVVEGSTGPGIQVTGNSTTAATENTITGNQVAAAGTYGLQIDANVAGLSVAGNTFDGATADVSIHASATGVVATANRLVHATTAGTGTFNQLGVLDATTVPGSTFTAAAGTSAKAAPADHSHPRHLWGPTDQALKAWTIDPALPGAGTAPTAGVLQFAKLHLPAAATITNIILTVVTAGATLTSGQCFAGLYTAAGAKIDLTGDQSAVWNSTGNKTMPLAAGPYAAAAGDYYIVWWSNGTTQPAFARAGTTNAMTVGLSVGTLRFGTANTGLTNAASAPSTMGSQTAALLGWFAALS